MCIYLNQIKACHTFIWLCPTLHTLAVAGFSWPQHRVQLDVDINQERSGEKGSSAKIREMGKVKKKKKPGFLETLCQLSREWV